MDVHEQLGVGAALEVYIGRRVHFLGREDRFEVVRSLLIETVYLRSVQVLQERDLCEGVVSQASCMASRNEVRTSSLDVAMV